jgi:phytoene dehydrogenase-like protein
MIDRFFRPFLGGIFFDRTLSVTSRLFEFVMRMLATGQNCLPADGIGAVATQLASSLPSGAISTGVGVSSISPAEGKGAEVTLADGSHISARLGVVVATAQPEAERLLGERMAKSPSKDAPPVGTACLYFKYSSLLLTPHPLLLPHSDSLRSY